MVSDLHMIDGVVVEKLHRLAQRSARNFPRTFLKWSRCFPNLNIQKSVIPYALCRCTGKPAHRGRRFATAVDEDKDMKQVSYDCFFMRDQPGSESAKILESKDRADRMVSAHVVPVTGEVVDWVIQHQITLKSDQEPASWMC